MFLPPTLAGSEGITRIWKYVNWETWRGKKTVTHQLRLWEDRRKFPVPLWGKGRNVVSNQMCNWDVETSEQESWSWNTKPGIYFNLCVSPLFLSSQHVVSLCPARAVDSSFILYLTRRLLKKCFSKLTSVLLKQDIVSVCLTIFISARWQPYIWYLRVQRFFGEVTLQPSIWDP